MPLRLVRTLLDLQPQPVQQVPLVDRQRRRVDPLLDAVKAPAHRGNPMAAAAGLQQFVLQALRILLPGQVRAVERDLALQ